jgi:KaiC/GvpD/RAD55 family RecA-like ATPase
MSNRGTLLKLIEALPPLAAGKYPCVMLEGVASYLTGAETAGWNDDGAISEALALWVGDSFAEDWVAAISCAATPIANCNEDGNPTGTTSLPDARTWRELLTTAVGTYGANVGALVSAEEAAAIEEANRATAEYIKELEATAKAKGAAHPKPPVLGQQGAGTPAIRVTAAKDILVERASDYVVKGLIAPRDLALLIGEPGAGKSVFAPHLAYSVSRGTAVFGHKTKRGPVLYIAAEDHDGIVRRFRALFMRHGPLPDDFYVIEGLEDVLNPDLAKSGRAACLALIEDYNPALVIIDTLAAAAPGLRENDAGDMGKVTEAARQLAGHGAAIVLVHHVPKGGDTPRGHGKLNGAADVVMKLDKDGSGADVWIELTKNRHGPSGPLGGFLIDSQVLGTDEDGDPVTAPIAVELPDASRAEYRRRAKAPKLLPKQAAAMRLLTAMLATPGATATLSTWRKACAADSRIIASDATADTKRTCAVRVTKALIAAGHVQVGVADGLTLPRHADDTEQAEAA